MIRAVCTCTSLLVGATMMSSCGNKGELYLASDPQTTQELNELVDPETPSVDNDSEVDDEPASSNKSKPKLQD